MFRFVIVMCVKYVRFLNFFCYIYKYIRRILVFQVWLIKYVLYLYICLLLLVFSLY